MSYHRLGDDAPTTAVAPAATSTPSLPSLPPTDKLAAAAMMFHGYRRTGSIFWALAYGLAGYEAPIVAVPIALAQGFGKKKPCP